jgi:hypothetical protein
MESQVLHYRQFESEVRLEFYALMDKYHSLKQKESMMAESKENKHSRKDMLLKSRADHTITKLGDIELAMIEHEDNIQTYNERNINTIEMKRDKKIRDAEAECERKIRDAENEYERVAGLYDAQKKQSMAKAKREYESKKKTLIARGETIEVERTFIVRSAGEIALERQKYDILKSINAVICRWKMSKSQCPPGTRFDGPDLTLPEPLPGSKTPTPVPSAPITPPSEPEPPRQESVTQPLGKYGMPLWLENMGETNLVLREQALREDAEARREADREENERKAEALARRQQYEAEVAETRKRNEEYQKKKSSGK